MEFIIPYGPYCDAWYKFLMRKCGHIYIKIISAVSIELDCFIE